MKKNKIIPVKSSDVLKQYQKVPLKLMRKMRQNPIKLSLKQNICANLLIQGLTTPQIARKLQLSPRTIETHVNQLKYKFDAANKSELIINVLKKINCLSV